MTPLDEELVRERGYHDTCRAALAAMVDGAQEQVITGEHASASGADAEVLGRRLRGKAKEMRELPQAPLYFGRLDFDPEAAEAGDHRGQRYHIGRLRITEDPAAPPLVVDWRAPVSRAFYQAGARDPQGVAVRRRFGWAPGSKGESADLTGLEDEHLTSGSGEAAAPSRIVAGEIERPRVGPMRDIAATIQPEQDDLVRAALTTSVCVQGAPGTGKTAVGLHRAAYLLYTHPQRVRRSGLLILGPNRTFLRYIAEVLPSLGETGVRQSTVQDEIARQPVTAYDDERAAVVKHDPRMAEVLRRALYARVTPVAADLALPDGSYRWRVPAADLERIVADVRAEEPPYDTGRERVRSRAVRHVQDQAERRAGPMSNTWVQKVSRARPVSAFVDAVWPKARPEEVLCALLGDADALARAADGLLAPEEQRAIVWARPPRSYKSAKWSAADLVLLDELAGLMERPEGYGHIVVDEAQDLSPMECRAIARRVGFGSVTVLGDLAQGTTPWAARAWPALLAHLGKPDAAVTPLTTGFRVPRAIVTLANDLLAGLDVDVPPARSLRRDGDLAVLRVPDAVAGAVAAVREALAREGSIGVIAADAATEALRAALAGAGIGAAGPDELGARVTVVPASMAKGLEYDHVVAVEPAAIAEAEERGPHRLYVVLTRAVSSLAVVHSRELPWAWKPGRAGVGRGVPSCSGIG
ncbi:HelD family protein [Streptomyces spectabilis]|uniref:AAA family ATPase n=1 Tax=Streptomyces spectabilis TaxID=68270 RepID=A0A5P2X6Y1_STRST|nr:AAA family ATPase [Streptomyces spectabilis]MBB5106574.1 DNA helicase IV [Streptomyces spectabilis]MCI3903569.1 AAA family ATPase [Streptomyces spectabilis]QEV60763.1 AAA family ATPase [Streptomyces spectabilis]